MFRNLGMVEIDFTSREIIREAIKLLGDAQQYLLHVRLDGEFRQSPGVVDLCMVAGWAAHADEASPSVAAFSTSGAASCPRRRFERFHQMDDLGQLGEKELAIRACVMEMTLERWQTYRLGGTAITKYEGLTPEERARIIEIQDSLIERFVEHKEAIEEGRRVRAKELEAEINELQREVGERNEVGGRRICLADEIWS
jgi:hypothetical protein